MKVLKLGKSIQFLKATYVKKVQNICYIKLNFPQINTKKKKHSYWFPTVRKFKETPFLLKGLTNKLTGYMDSLVKEATEK